MNNSKNEVVKKIVKEMREKFFCRYYDNELAHYKVDLNIYFIDELIEEHGIEKVTQAGLTFLFELKEDEMKFIERIDYGKPKEVLKYLFEKALKEGYEKELAKAVFEMYKKGNENSLFLFEILKGVITKESMPSLEKLSKDMKKERNDSWTSSSRKDVKRKFIQINEVAVSDFLTISKQPGLFPQPH